MSEERASQGKVEGLGDTIISHLISCSEREEVTFLLPSLSDSRLWSSDHILILRVRIDGPLNS
jgi:hypothetical protein